VDGAADTGVAGGIVVAEGVAVVAAMAAAAAPFRDCRLL